MISTNIKNTALQFETAETVFSPSHIDPGTLAMLSETEFLPGDRVLDLGCGCGVVGILAAKLIGEENVVMSDISEKAVECAGKNAVLNGVENVKIVHSDGFENITGNDFTLILSNPPYHSDFSVPKRFIEQGFRRLAVGGRMVMVTKRLDWYKNKLTSVFGGVKIKETGGYYVFISEKRSRTVKEKSKPVQKLSKKLQRKYAGLSGSGK